MDPRLKHMVAVARSGSFTAAAQLACVTQSAVTKSVADLERQLGYALFHRAFRGAQLTERGRDFYERAARLLEDARELLEDSTEKGDPFAGVLRVGLCPASLEWRVIDPLALLLSQHPGIRLEVTGSSFERMAQQLRNGAVDVAVGFDAAFKHWPDVRREPLPAVQTTLFVRKEHPILTHGPPKLADIAKYDFVAPSESRPYGESIRALYESQGVDWRRRLHVVDYYPLVRRIVATSDAIGVVTLAHAASGTFRQRFATLDHLDPFSPLSLCCAVRERWEPKPAVRAFIRAMSARLPTIPGIEVPTTPHIPGTTPDRTRTKSPAKGAKAVDHIGRNRA